MNAMTTSACLKSWSWVQSPGNRWVSGNTAAYLMCRSMSKKTKAASHCAKSKDKHLAQRLALLSQNCVLFKEVAS